MVQSLKSIRQRVSKWHWNENLILKRAHAEYFVPMPFWYALTDLLETLHRDIKWANEGQVSLGFSLICKNNNSFITTVFLLFSSRCRYVCILYNSNNPCRIASYKNTWKWTNTMNQTKPRDSYPSSWHNLSTCKISNQYVNV